MVHRGHLYQCACVCVRSKSGSKKSSVKGEHHEAATRLSALGFPVEICMKALEATQFDENRAGNWLMDNGVREMRKSKQKKTSKPTTKKVSPNTFEEAEWGTEGVDFFQELGDGNIGRYCFPPKYTLKPTHVMFVVVQRFAFVFAQRNEGRELSSLQRSVQSTCFAT